MIDERIRELGDWRGKMLSRLRTLIKQADPKVVEEWKGAALVDPSGLFNSSLDGNTRRAIDFHEGEKIDEKALKALIRAAVRLNASRAQESAREP
jgi:hypothetical protein